MDTKTLCLGVISRGAASGYEIKKAFEDGALNHIYDTSYGSIYPALTALTKQGLAVCAEMAQDKRPDKKVYSITEAGRAALLSALMMPPASDKFRSDFLFMMYFAELLPASRLAQLVDQRIAWYESCLEDMVSGDPSQCSAGGAFVHGLGTAVYQAAADYLKANRDRLLGVAADTGRLVAE
jgi:DNA-binding PadR family transcriptional regulator